MAYNNYELRMVKKNDTDKELYFGWATGTTLEDAIKHADFWNAKGDTLAEDFEILEAKVTGTTSYYPYKSEDILRRAFEEKDSTIAKIEACGACDEDKEDLIAVIENKDAATFKYLATACRDWLYDLMA